MSYPINQAITYTAAASTTGMPSNTFAYAWSFDDGGTGNTASLSHTWASSGSHSATVTATDNITGGVATASKAISLSNWTALTWVTTAYSILPTGSSPNNTVTYPLITYGNYIINVAEYYHPEVIVVFNTSSGTVSQYTNSTLGAIGGGCVLTTGPNSGKLLLVGVSSGKYAFMDISTGTFTIGTATLPHATPSASGTRPVPFEYMGNGKLFYSAFGYNGFTYVNQSMTYDPVADLWQDASTWTGIPAFGGMRFFKLPSGKLILQATDKTPSFYIYDYTNSAVTSAAPSSNPFGSTSFYMVSQLHDLSLVAITSGSLPVMTRWVEGTPNWVPYSTNYPVASQAGFTQNVYQSWVVTPDNFMINIAGSTTSGTGTPNTKTVFYNTNNDSYVVGANLPNAGYTEFACFCNGAAWIQNNSGFLQYMTWA